MPNPIVHWEIGSNDAGKTAAFYREVFGWNTQTVEGEAPYELVDTGVKEHGIQGGFAQSPEHPGVTFYIEVEDIDATLGAIEGNGGTTIMPRTELPMITMAMFTDPDGHAVGIIEKGSGQAPS